MNDLVETAKITGEVLLDGEDIYGNMDVNLLRKRVGMVFQKPNPFPMSIYDNVAYGPRTHGLRNKVKLDDLVETALRNAAIWDETKDRLKHNALGLSGGQQQRVAIARALAMNPDIMLYDEPTTGLDPITSEEISSLMLQMQKKYNTSSIIISHDMRCAQIIANRLVVMIDGINYAQGTFDYLEKINDPKVHAFFK